MNKLKKIFNKLAISFALLGAVSAGAFFMTPANNSKSVADAEFSQYQEISNDLPAFVDIIVDETTQIGKVEDTIYLFQNDSFQNVQIGSHIIPNTANDTQANYGYYPDQSNTSEYYYFDFQTSLSLYYNLTNEDIKSGLTGENLLKDKNISDFTQEQANPFVPIGYSFTPQMFDLQIKLNTTLTSLQTTGNQVTLYQEGCYTLAIPISVYKTDNNGTTFTLSESTVYYTFMIFNANTYFDGVTGRPNIVPSANMQESLVNSSSAYSNYYFYNFAYGHAVNSLPTISYNPDRFQLQITFTDINQTISTSVIECKQGKIYQLDQYGNEIKENNKFIEVNYNQNGDSVVTFTKLGSYDISISYLYIAKTDSQTTYRLPLEKLESNEVNGLVFKNKAQRLFMYGYQAVYSDYSDIDPETNQPKSQELKTFDFENNTYGKDQFAETFNSSADITSAVNNYIIKNSDSDADKNNAGLQNPTLSTAYTTSSLREYALKYIQQNNIKPISTNQTPVKFITNTTLQSQNGYSQIYNVTSTDVNDNSTISLEYQEGKNYFQGFNQNNAGTYLYIIQYTFDSYMSTSGTLQSGFYHYQIFYFKVTNTTPTITVFDYDANEIYTGGFTNKSVYVLNDAENNMFDAEVEITISAKDYKTGKDFFPATNIKNLASYGIVYQKFDEKEDLPENEDYNNSIAGKYGVLIEKDSKYANAFYTIKILSANTDKPSTRTFTIDTNPITNIVSRSASVASSTAYKVGESITHYATNKPFVLSWDNKKSEADTFGFIKYIPLTAINYYSSLNEDKLAELLSRLISHDTLPVSYKLDLKNATEWTEYTNSESYQSTIPTTYVKSNDGIYILEVYDEAGNNAFAIFLKDSTSPIFIEEIVGDTTIRKLISNSESISVPDEGIEISINWTKNKAIFIENLEDFTSFEVYKYGINKEEANTKLQTTLNSFFNPQINNSLQTFNDITVETTKENDPDGFAPTGIVSYNGTYLIIPIEEKAYIKDAKSSSYTAIDGTSYKIQFIDENDEAIEGTYKILIRDKSNSDNFANENLNYTIYPSGYLSFNVTSDASKLMVEFENGEVLDYSSYNMSGSLYSFKDENENVHYTHLPNNGKDDESFAEYEETELSYKFLYHTPVTAKQELNLSFVPVAENGSKLSSIVLSYYPYELQKEIYEYEENGETKTKYHYYYTISQTPTRTINVFTLSDKTYDQNQEENFAIALGTDSLPLAGRYVVERLYVDGNATDKYDYFKRTITFTVDNFSIISPLESVTNEDGSASSLESVVGGDVVLSMYSDDNLSAIEVSFPRFNENGLSTGSFYTKDSFTDDENLSVFSVQGNKLPMSLYIPKAKYTIASYRNISEDGKAEYNVTNNNELAYYGHASYKQNAETGMYDVYVEGVVVESFGTADMAKAYIENNISIVEYQIKAEVKATVVENGKTITKYYYSNGTTTNGYLNLYLADGKNGNLVSTSTPLEFFYQKGEYVVTLYQASNIGVTSNFYSIYKFGFKIVSQEPNFKIYGSDGYELTATNLPNVYYTNSDSLTVEWEVPTNVYQAKIDENSINIRSYPSTSPAVRGEIVDGTNSRYFVLDTSRCILNANSYITITMQYEGYNSNYYSTITKTVYFDRSAPTQNLVGLMDLTASATVGAFPTNYQQYFMREYYDYTGAKANISAGIDLSNMSYSYSTDSGYFKYFSYNVTKEFFNVTLKQTLTDAINFSYDTQYIYYKSIDNIQSYTQVDKSSFSAGNYYYITTDGDAEVYCGYYEIVELDYAGNMTVYIVYLIDSTILDDPNVRTDALTYSNNTHINPVTVADSQITNGFNIYSNSGFEISELNYKSDPWALLNVTLSGQSTTRYMKSPWLEESLIYKVSFTSAGITLEQIALSSIFDGVDSTSYKHQLVFTDRVLGTNSLVYLSIMDASLSTQKVEDPTKTSAILNISIPTLSQYQSSTISYAFPTSIIIYQYDQNMAGADKWKTIMIADQLAYGEWVAQSDYETALEYISFTILGSGNVLQVAINLGVNASQKIKYEIVDNFGNVTTIIQLANEISYKEIDGDGNIYSFTEADSSQTYVSAQTVRYSYNVLLYNVTIFDRNGNDITETIERKDNATTNISILSFKPTESLIYDDYYKIVIKDSESGADIKTIHVRLVYNLPYLTFVANEVHSGGIVFNDKNQQPIDTEYVNSVSSMTVNFNGVPYTTSGYAISSYDNVTIRFKNGQDYAYEGTFEYQHGYTYSVYLSRDNGQTWENINSSSSAISGHTLSGVGEYTILIKYDSEQVFNTLCKIFTVTIIDQDKFPLYSVRVDNLPVEKSDIKYTSQANYEYEINYVISVDWADKDNRLTIIANEEKGVVISLISEESTGSNVHVEIYHYTSNDNREGYFTIIYIEETNNIVSTFTYDTPAGTTEALKDKAYEMVAVSNENSVEKLKLNFSTYYGIKENKIKPQVQKLFNGQYVDINCEIYDESSFSYIYLEKAGSYRIRLYDSCTPANVQTFKNSQFIDIVFLNTVPFVVSHADENGTIITTEPIQKAVYNTDVTIELTNVYTDSYYETSGYPAISVKLNGKEYTDYKVENRKFLFSEPGFYSVLFTAKSMTGVQIREEEYNFSIVKKNELKYSYEITEYNKYYIEKVIKDGIDITQALVNTGNFNTVVINGVKYLSNLSLANSTQDEKTGDGRYKITLCPNNKAYENVTGKNFTFELRIGHVTTLPINVSIGEGESTSKEITVSFNVRNLYEAVGDCYIKVANRELILTEETIANYMEVETITISGAGTHYVQVYTLSGRPLYSYKVIKTEPLNAFAVIAIVVGVIAFVAIIVITIKIRKRQKVK